MKISRDKYWEAVNSHFDLWNWLAEDGYRTKDQYFEEEYAGEYYLPNNCFACKLAQDLTSTGEDRCDNCPITDKYDRLCVNGLWEVYRELENPRHRALIAGAIRDLPWDKNDILDKIED